MCVPVCAHVCTSPTTPYQYLHQVHVCPHYQELSQPQITTTRKMPPRLYIAPGTKAHFHVIFSLCFSSLYNQAAKTKRSNQNQDPIVVLVVPAVGKIFTCGHPPILFEEMRQHALVHSPPTVLKCPTMLKDTGRILVVTIFHPSSEQLCECVRRLPTVGKQTFLPLMPSTLPEPHHLPRLPSAYRRRIPSTYARPSKLLLNADKRNMAHQRRRWFRFPCFNKPRNFEEERTLRTSGRGGEGKVGGEA